jgi:hypothetical protein
MSQSILGTAVSNVVAQAKQILSDIPALQLQALNGLSSGERFTIPGIGPIDPNNPIELGKIEIFNQLLASTTQIVTSILTNLKSIEEQSGRPLQ